MNRSQLTRDSLRRSGGGSSGGITLIQAGSGIAVLNGSGPTVTVSASAGGDLQIVANVAALIAIDVTSATDFPTGSVAWVATLKDYFVLNRSSAVTNDTTNYLYVTATVGRWVRQCEANEDWTQTITWEIDGTAGSNEATGAVGFPLKTWSELARRVTGLCFNTATVTVNILTSLASSDPIFVDFDVMNTSNASPSAGALKIVGTRTTVTSGTVGAVTVQDPTTNTLYTIDGGLAAHVGKYIRFLNGVTFRCSGWIVKDLGSGNVGLSTTTSENGGAAGTKTDPVVGDAFEVYTFPTVPAVVATARRNTSVSAVNLDVAGGAAATSAITKSFGGAITSYRGCLFSNSPSLTFAEGGVLNNCLFRCNFSGIGSSVGFSTTINAGAFLLQSGASNRTIQFTGEFTFTNSPTSVALAVRCPATVSSSSSGNSFAVFDCPGSETFAFYLIQNCRMVFASLWGSGNAVSGALIGLHSECSLIVTTTLSIAGSSPLGIALEGTPNPIKRALLSTLAYSDLQDISGNTVRAPGDGGLMFGGDYATNKPALCLTGQTVVPFRVIRSEAVTGAIYAQADTSAHATGVTGVSMSDCTSGENTAMVNGGYVALNFDVAPTAVGQLVYLSPTTAGNATVTVPPASGTNQKLRLGYVVRLLSGTLAVVHFRPELVPVTSDGATP